MYEWEDIQGVIDRVRVEKGGNAEWVVDALRVFGRNSVFVQLCAADENKWTFLFAQLHITNGYLRMCGT